MNKVTKVVIAFTTMFLSATSIAEYRFNYSLKGASTTKGNNDTKKECFVSGSPAFYIIENNHPGRGIYHRIAWNDEIIQDYDAENSLPTTLPLIKDGYSYTKGALFWESDPMPGSSFYEKDYEVCRQAI